MSKLKTTINSLFAALVLTGLPLISLGDFMPNHDTVCNFIAQYDSEDDTFEVNGRPFHDSDFNYPDSNNHLHWYVEAFNLTTKETFYCSCLNMPDGNECTPSS